MKKIFIPSMMIALAMICSCQKQDSAAEQQLAQRQTELDAREKALEERQNELTERVNALAETQKTTMNARMNATAVQGQIPDSAQLEAEKQRMIQQLSRMIPDPAKVTAGDPTKQERPAPRQLGPEDLQRQWQRNLDKARMSGKVVFPATEVGSPTPSPAVEATSSSPSPTPE